MTLNLPMDPIAPEFCATRAGRCAGVHRRLVRALCRVGVWIGLMLVGLVTLGSDPVRAGDDGSQQIYESVLAALVAASGGTLLVLDPTVKIEQSMIERADRASIGAVAGSPERLERLRALSQAPISLESVVRDRERWVVLSADEQKALHVGTPEAVQEVRAAYPRATRRSGCRVPPSMRAGTRP